MRHINNFNNIKQGIKGSILITISSILFWNGCVMVALDSPIKYVVTACTLAADDICLFLMFESGDKIYDKLCGYLCNNCCTKIIFKSH